MGSSTVSYSIQKEAAEILREGILENPLIQLPAEVKDCAKRVKFEGCSQPSIPINWRLAESVSALKGLEAAVTAVLLKKKYDVDSGDITINTDHAQLFIMSAVLYTVDPTGQALNAASSSGVGADAQKMAKYFPNCDKHRSNSTPHRFAATNIYKTKDERYFHLHGSMNPDLTLDNIGLPHERECKSTEESWPPYFEAMAKFTSVEIDHRSNNIFHQPGTICWSIDEFAASEHGRANAHAGLFEVVRQPDSNQPAGWWNSAATTSAKRPLAGLKVLDLTRVIAGPALTRGLAELGASVMRVTSPEVTDMSPLHPDLNWGKWNCHLDFTVEKDRTAMKDLILSSDVIVDGYRPGVMDKWGFGQQDVFKMCAGRERGMIYVRENCYGWHGSWSSRCGWQQISDACTGVSMKFGEAMGLQEPVTPIFPNSDYCTGIAGVVGVLTALLAQSEEGGSYKVDVALNYYNTWLINSVGTYPEHVWNDVWSRIAGKHVFRHYHGMLYTLPRCLGMLYQKAADVLFRGEFFEERDSGALGVPVRTIKPVLRWEGRLVEPGFNVGTRGNGVDAPLWPGDLHVEVVH